MEFFEISIRYCFAMTLQHRFDVNITYLVLINQVVIFIVERGGEVYKDVDKEANVDG